VTPPFCRISNGRGNGFVVARALFYDVGVCFPFRFELKLERAEEAVEEA